MIRLTRMFLFLLPLFLLARPVVGQAQPNVDAVLNGASYDGAVSPGCWIAIFGSDLATAVAAAESVPLPKSLGGVTVTIGGIEAPLSFVGPDQINALIPFEVEIPESGVVTLTVTTSEGSSNPYTIFINRVSPALFTINAQGTGRTFVLSPDFQTVDPVAEDDVVILYATGLGQTDPPAKSDEGGSSAEPFNRVTEEMKVYIGDQEADVLFAGLAPGFPGVFQLNVRVPSPATDRVFLSTGGWQSNIVEAGIQEGQNATIMEAKIQGVYPPTDPLDGQILPPVEPLSLPLVPHVGRFEVELEILPDAEPFFVAAVGDVGNSIILIDPAQGTYEGTVTLPTEKSRMWDFSNTEFTSLREYLSCRTEGCDLFPDNVIPLVRVEPNSFAAVQLLSLSPNTEIPRSSVELLKVSGVLESDSFVAGEFTDNSSLSQFGGFLQFPFGPLSERTAAFKLYVDGRLVASSTTAYEVVSSRPSLAFVTIISNNTVEVIDTSTNSVSGAIPVGEQPAGIAVTSGGTRAYVANRGSGDVSVIDTSSKTVVATIPLGDTFPGLPAIGVAPDGRRVYAASNTPSFGACSVSVIDTSSNTVVDTIPVCSGLLSHIVVHPFSHQVFVSHDSSVSVIDASTNSVVTTVPVGDQLSGGTAGLQVAPGSGRIYVAKQFGPSDPGSVFVVDRSTNAVVGGPIPVGVSPSAVAVAPDGSRVLIGNGGSRNISIIDTSTDSVMATVSLDGTADGIAVTSDGSHAYVASQNPALVSVINLATNSVVGTIPVSGNAVGVAITP